MKKLLLVVPLLGLIACQSPETTSGVSGVIENPDAYYEIDGWGADPDIYEFTPKANRNYSCAILVSGGDKSVALQCFPKGDNYGQK